MLGGCANMPGSSQPAPQKAPAPAPEPQPAPPPPEPATPPPPSPQAELSDGIALYDKGDYNAAITKLAAVADMPGADVKTQVAAHKYQAFSYCLTNRQTLCRTQFDKAFKLDPAFDLEPAERGHPMWTPAFERVKRANKAPPK
jgi:hypothetical protein